MAGTGLLKRLTTFLRRGDAAAVAARGQLTEQERAAVDERTNLSHTGQSPYGPTNNSGGGAFFGGGGGI